MITDFYTHTNEGDFNIGGMINVFPDVYYYANHNKNVIKSYTLRQFTMDGKTAHFTYENGDVGHAKLIIDEWFLHNENDFATQAPNDIDIMSYLFYNKGRNCCIEELPCDGETKLYLTLKYTRVENDPRYNSLIWYVI